MRIIAVGQRFFPSAHPGDKTFWLRVFQRLGARGHEIHVISIDRRPRASEPAGCNVTIDTIPAVPVYLRAGAQATRYNPESVDIGAITNYGSKLLTLPRVIRAVREKAHDQHADVVHFVDNLGPAVWPFVARLEIPAFASAITYDPRYVFYDSFLRASFEGFSGVGATSDTFRERLVEIGLPRRRLRTVRWGADPNEYVPAPDRAALKAKLGLPPTTPLVFWAGYIQQITEADFRLAYRAVVEARRTVPELVAYFCFKPAHFRPSFHDLSGPNIRLVGDGASFALARSAADLFLSPVTRGRSILAPPLTWVEAMMQGLPILTTPCGAASEILDHGRAGEAVEWDRLSARIVELVRDPTRLSDLRTRARDWAAANYSLEHSADALNALWHELT
ncbi:MAG: glycosyltransferase family 4 protein [Thermoplasmata archaeon]